MRLFVHRTSSASLRVTIFMSLAGVPRDLVEMVQTGLKMDHRGIPVYTLPDGDPVTEAGLHFRLPFVQDVRRFEKRILQWDGDAEEIAVFWMDRLFAGQYTQDDIDLAVEFITTNDLGDDQTLSPAANLYEDRLRKFAAYLAAYPQSLKQ